VQYWLLLLDLISLTSRSKADHFTLNSGGSVGFEVAKEAVAGDYTDCLIRKESVAQVEL